METIGRPGVLSRDARPGAVGLLAALAGLAVGAAGLADWWFRGWHPWDGMAVLAGIALVVAPFRLAGRRARERRTAAVLDAWARARGLVYQTEAGNPRTTPTLEEGGLLSPVLVGTVGGDPHGFLAHYAYLVRVGSKSHTIRMSVAVARFEGREGLRLRLRATSPVHGVPIGVFDDWHAFATSSAQVAERYVVEAGEGHDPVLLHELLDPVALVELMDERMPPLVEIDCGTLLVAFGGHIGIDPGVQDLAWFDRLREHADRWGARVQGI